MLFCCLNLCSLTYLVLWLSEFAYFWLVQVSSVKLMALYLWSLVLVAALYRVIRPPFSQAPMCSWEKEAAVAGGTQRRAWWHVGDRCEQVGDVVWCNDQLMSRGQVDTACTPLVVQWVTNATREGRKLHGHAVSDRARVLLSRSGLLQRWQCCRWETGEHCVAVVKSWQLEDWDQSCRDITAELSTNRAYTAQMKANRSGWHVIRAGALIAQSRSTRRDHERRSLAWQRRLNYRIFKNLFVCS